MNRSILFTFAATIWLSLWSSSAFAQRDSDTAREKTKPVNFSIGSDRNDTSTPINFVPKKPGVIQVTGTIRSKSVSTNVRARVDLLRGGTTVKSAEFLATTGKGLPILLVYNADSDDIEGSSNTNPIWKVKLTNIDQSNRHGMSGNISVAYSTVKRRALMLNRIATSVTLAPQTTETRTFKLSKPGNIVIRASWKNALADIAAGAKSMQVLLKKNGVSKATRTDKSEFSLTYKVKSSDLQQRSDVWTVEIHNPNTNVKFEKILLRVFHDPPS